MKTPTKTNEGRGENPPVQQRRIVRLVPETPRWSKVAKKLKSIENNADKAIHAGFVQGKTKVLHQALFDIEQSARATREMLESNVRSCPDRKDSQPTEKL